MKVKNAFKNYKQTATILNKFHGEEEEEEEEEMGTKSTSNAVTINTKDDITVDVATSNLISSGKRTNATQSPEDNEEDFDCDTTK